jgi:hypothetical protein
VVRYAMMVGLFSAVLGAGFSASSSPALAFDGFGAFDEALPTCTAITSVKVDGTQARHHYAFVLLCYDGADAANVEGAYDYASGRASEKISGKGWSFTSRWDCADDPWIAASHIACGNPKTQTKGSAGEYERLTLDSPLSAYELSAQSRHVLAAQLNNALSAATQPPAAPSVKKDKLLGKAPEATDHSSVLKPASSEDLTIVRIDGPSTLPAGQSASFSILVGNVGNLAGPVEVNILFAGALDQTGQVSADSGLACDSVPGNGKVHTNLHCTGGQLYPQRSATITIQSVGMTPGAGSIIASANNSRSVDESDYGNNLGKRDVVVQ